MQRARRAANAVLVLVVVLCLSSGPATVLPVSVQVARAASAAWPTSTLVLSEVQTGGAGASDEFVEIANQGSGPVDLIGLELVYATSSGSTVTRKATWAGSTIVAAGQRLLVANGAGSYVAVGDATYTGGFAATGGALALRIVGGSVVDSIAWGDATNAFVEGTAVPAPPAGSSLERRPGGLAGNGSDTNDNASDWFVSAAPGPQNLSAPPIPAPAASPSPTPTVEPTPTPSPLPPPSPEPSDIPVPTVESSPTPTPTPSPTPAPISIAVARALPDGASATVSGVLTTDLGALELGRTAFLQDGTGGIGLYLDAPVVAPLAAGATLMAIGTVDDRYGQRTLRVSEADLVLLGTTNLPAAVTISTGAVSEQIEGRIVAVTGAIVGAADILADGTAVTVDDGGGQLRVIVTPSALGGRELLAGSLVTASGPLGQRDSSGTGTSGYRLHVIRSGDLEVAVPASPTLSPTPEPTSAPTPSPSATPSPSPSPSASPSPTPTPTGITIATARALPVGSIVTVRGVVTAEPGRLGTPALIAIGDATGGIVVKLPASIAALPRGHVVDVRGVLADPYGQLEIRPAAATDVVLGATAEPSPPLDLPATGPDETSEGRLARIAGVVVVRASKATNSAIALTIETSNGTRVRILADASSGVVTSAFDLHARYRITGIAGQRATKKGVPDGYRIWIRDANDIVLVAAAPPSASPSPSSGPSHKPKPSPSRSPGTTPTVSIATALRTTDRDVAIEAVVTASASLLDTTGRRIVVQDATGAVEVLLPKVDRAPAVGTRIRAIGRMGAAYGAPRLRAQSVESRGRGSVPTPLRINGPLTKAHTWRLVAIGGRVESVRKLGERWRAELVLGTTRLAVVGQPGSRIPSTALVEGRIADVVGIVRPAYPSATDRRSAVLPRSRSDIRLAAAGSSTGTAGTSVGAGTGGATGGPTVGASSSVDLALVTAPDADLVDLASLLGETVRVGGLVVDLHSDGFTLDDGTAVGLVVLTGPAEDLLALIEPADAINVVGRVDRVDGGQLAVVVDDPAAISLGTALDGMAGASPPTTAGASDAAGAHSDLRVAGLGTDAPLVPGAGAGLIGLVGIGLASLAVTVLRRRQIRQLLAARIDARLAPITPPSAASDGPPAA
jgi:lamin tail-like protein